MSDVLGSTAGDCDTRRVLVTGACCDPGYAIAAALLSAGAHVIVTARSSDEARAVSQRLVREPAAGVNNDPRALANNVLDVADLDSVRGFARRWRRERVDAVIHAAEPVFDACERSRDGLERTFQTHLVAPFLLTTLLLDTLLASGHGRVVTVVSRLPSWGRLNVDRLTDPGGEYRGPAAYMHAKRAQLALTTDWARRFGGIGVSFSVAHIGVSIPSAVASRLPLARVPAGKHGARGTGVDTAVDLAIAERAPIPDGGVWHDRRRRTAYRLPGTRPKPGETGELWARACTAAGVHPRAPVHGP